MAASLVKRFYFAFCVSGTRRVHVPFKYNLHYRIVETDYRGPYRVNCPPSLYYGSKAGGYTQDEHINIPVDRLTISYSRSGGPGGQHVNKVNTKAEIRFHVQTADWIPEEARKKILQRNKTRINKAGELFITSEVSRSQQRNLEDCLQKISDIVAEANKKPHEPTAEAIALRHARLEKRKRDVLKQKKMKSILKRSRRVDFD